MASCRFRKVSPRCRRLAKGRKGPRMRKEATLPIAERMENVFFAEISIDPGEDIALPEAARRPGLSAALRHGDLPEALLQLIESMRESPDFDSPIFRSGFSERGKEEDIAYEAGAGCISAT